MELLAEIEVPCPHCGEVFPLEIDTSQGDQSMIEDCSICCRPITLRLHCRPGAILDFAVEE